MCHSLSGYDPLLLQLALTSYRKMSDRKESTPHRVRKRESNINGNEGFFLDCIVLCAEKKIRRILQHLELKHVVISFFGVVRIKQKARILHI